METVADDERTIGLRFDFSGRHAAPYRSCWRGQTTLKLPKPANEHRSAPAQAPYSAKDPRVPKTFLRTLFEVGYDASLPEGMSETEHASVTHDCGCGTLVLIDECSGNF
jgi:hypothetical protein